jgi:exonuclease III
MGKKGRVQCISEVIQRENLDFIGIQETKKHDFSDKCLADLGRRKEFCWNWLPSTGSAGGILLGFNSDIFEVEIWCIKKFSINSVVVNKKDKFKCRICVVYGAVDEENKQEFLDELHDCVVEYNEPLLIGGDFNLVRSQKDKSNEVVDIKWCDKYNEWFNRNSLIEIGLTERDFTWSNNQERVIISHIDRIFCSTEFEAQYPLATARALPRNPSDHAPILWESGHGQLDKKPRFKIKKRWLKSAEFKELVKKVWSNRGEGDKAIDRWQYRIRLLRKKARGWSMNVDAEYRRKKQTLSSEFESLDVKAETTNLSRQERENERGGERAE